MQEIKEKPDINKLRQTREEKWFKNAVMTLWSMMWKIKPLYNLSDELRVNMSGNRHGRDVNRCLSPGLTLNSVDKLTWTLEICTDEPMLSS